MPAKYIHRGFPSFMRAQLYTASLGGSAGYADAGFTLGCHLADECPFDADIDEWSAELHRIATFIHDDAMLEQWLRQTFPRIMALVPTRRGAQFVAGVQRAHSEGLTGFD